MRRSRAVGAIAALAAALGLGAVATTGSGEAGQVSSRLTACSTAKGILYYPVTDGTVIGLDLRRAPGGLTPGSEAEVKLLTASAFTGVGAGVAYREIAIDPAMQLMWYSTVLNRLHSVHVDTNEQGPSILVERGANPQTARHVFIDPTRRQLLTPITDGSVARYSLSDGRFVGEIPGSAFPGGISTANRAFRHLAADVRTGTIWVATTSNEIVEMDPVTGELTGRRVPGPALAGAATGVLRHLAVDPARDLLLYGVTDGSVRSIELTTLQPASLEIPPSAFRGANPGAFRTITLDPQAGGVLRAPGRVSFPTTTLGRARIARFVVRNAGKEPLAMGLSASGQGFRYLGPRTVCLDPGESVRLGARFAPPARGNHAGEVTILSTAKARVTTIRLVGRGS